MEYFNFSFLIKGVPICSGFCDEWYEACKMDQICVENVLTGYNFTSNNENFCPSDKNCTSYELMYGNGKNLCEKMWAGSYNYTRPNVDYSNCLMMNGSVSHTTTPGEKPTVAKGFSCTAWALLVILMALAVMQWALRTFPKTPYFGCKFRMAGCVLLLIIVLVSSTLDKVFK